MVDRPPRPIPKPPSGKPLHVPCRHRLPEQPHLRCQSDHEPGPYPWTVPNQFAHTHTDGLITISWHHTTNTQRRAGKRSEPPTYYGAVW